MSKVNVGPKISQPTHHISLSDGTHEFGLKLKNGWLGMNEVPQTATTINIAGGASKYGDWEPNLAQIGQSTWIGGRGNVDFSLDSTSYFDGYMAFSMVDGHIFPCPQWRMAEGAVSAYNKLPGADRANLGNDLSWQSLKDNYYAQQFTPNAAFSATNIELWLRKIGEPQGALTVELRSDSSGDPGTVLQSDTVSESSIDDHLSEFHRFTITAQSLTAGTKYWVVVYDAGTGTTTNHWEVGVGSSDSDEAKFSTDSGSTWEATTSQLFFRVRAAVTAGRFRFFEFRGALYKVFVPASDAASTLYINGDRGEATGGASTTLTDTDGGEYGGWTVNIWTGARVKIVKGTGVGQSRLISSNTAFQLTVSSAWDINPSTDSLYVIYSTDIWLDISPSSGDEFDQAITGKPVVAADVVYFPRGNDVDLFKMQYNEGASPPAHQFRDDTGDKGDLVYGFTDTTNEYQLFVADNAAMTVTRYSTVAYASNLSGGTAITIGDTSALMNNLADYNGSLYVFKEDGLYQVSSDKALREDTGLEFIRSNNMGEAVQNRNFFLYFSWGGYEVVQLQKNASIVDMANIGPNRNEGMPAARRGRVSALGFHPSGLLVAVDADTGTSSVLIRTDPIGYHEIFRAPCAGLRIRDMYWQDNPGTNPRLWFDLGHDVAFQEWPFGTFNPLKDTGMNYQHETHFIMADMDMGSPRLEKYWHQFNIVSENLTTGVYFEMDYQIDEDIGGSTWTNAGPFFDTPFDVVSLNLGNSRKIRMRIRMLTKDASNPPVARATVMEGYARTPLKYQWNVMVVSSTYQYIATTGQQDHKPPDLRQFLKDAAVKTRRLRMRSQIEDMHDIFVLVEPASSFPKFSDPIGKAEGWEMSFTIRQV